MSGVCIVCLGELGESASNPLQTHDTAIKVEDNIDKPIEQGLQLKVEEVQHDSDTTGELIAHLLPCGHDLHDECLKPWVERANSCPICRQNFNEVQLCQTIGGPVISSYAVQERKQAAEIDPNFQIGEEEEDIIAPCIICGRDENDEVLLLCDECDNSAHTYCLGLHEIPDGNWFCPDCAISRTVDDSSSASRTVRRRSTRLRTALQTREARRDADRSSASWARVWQVVWDQLNFDLDFPYDDEDTVDIPEPRQTLTQRAQESREFRAWHRRIRIADRQGVGQQFREIAPTLLERTGANRNAREPSVHETREEILAWNQMEKARDIERSPGNSSKRKSATTSPSENNLRRKRPRSITASPASPIAPIRPERRLKRPQTRRAHEAAASIPPASDAGPSRLRTRSVAEPRHAGNVDLEGAGSPSFLQSLLREVETTSTTPDEHATSRASLITDTLHHPVPQHNSPLASPSASNHPSPRLVSTTPPPPHSPRASSPAPLTSRIEPIYTMPPPNLITTNNSARSDDEDPASPNPAKSLSHRNNMSRRNNPAIEKRTADWVLSSPTIPEAETAFPKQRAPSPTSATNGNSRQVIEHQPLAHRAHPDPAPSRPRAEEHSPTRGQLSLTTKENIQKLVKDALRVHWQAQSIDKDQYTEINKSISRLMYDRIGEGTIDLDSSESKVEMWRKMASDEVQTAVDALQEGGQRSMTVDAA